jgi:hypothetical protein
MAELLGRLDKLTPASQRQWGTMDVAQMMAHCSNAISQQLGDTHPTPTFFGRIFGPLVRNKVTNEKPFDKGLPTDPSFKVVDAKDFAQEKAKLQTLITRLCQSKPDIFHNRRHVFFGKMSTQQWNNLAYKHLDHHFRQFGV